MPTCAVCDGAPNSDSTARGTNLHDYDAMYMNQLCDAFKVSIWPPDFRKLNCSAVEARKKIRLLGVGKLEASTCDHTGKKKEVTFKELEAFTEEATSLCRGLCLQCVREGEGDLISECQDTEHKQKIF